LWDDARPVAGTPAEAYLAARGLGAAPAELRYHPETPLGARPFTQFRPALIAAVRDRSGLVAVHRTFIDDCDLAVAGHACQRRGLGRYGLGAVRLGGSARRLGLAEGIETALSATALFGVPCWATLGTERFRRIELPEEVRELLLFLDHDDAGRRAGRLARAAFKHVARIAVHIPRRAGADWNDVLRSIGEPPGSGAVSRGEAALVEAQCGSRQDPGDQPPPGASGRRSASGAPSKA
jgi:hypothetical protein